MCRREEKKGGGKKVLLGLWGGREMSYTRSRRGGECRREGKRSFLFLVRQAEREGGESLFNKSGFWKKEKG